MATVDFLRRGSRDSAVADLDATESAVADLEATDSTVIDLEATDSTADNINSDSAVSDLEATDSAVDSSNSDDSHFANEYSLFSDQRWKPWAEDFRRQRFISYKAAACQSWFVGYIPDEEPSDDWYDCTDYSRKIYIKGATSDVTEDDLVAALKDFEPIDVEKKPEDVAMHSAHGGYLYMTFLTEKAINRLLMNCVFRRNTASGDNTWHFLMPSKDKEIEIIPWQISDKHYFGYGYRGGYEADHTIFLRSLHGKITANALGHIMGTLFGYVAHAKIYVDEDNYPTGFGRVTFATYDSFMKAIVTGFVDIEIPRFRKKVMIDPYVAVGAECSSCMVHNGTVYCKDFECLQYYCGQCWRWTHLVDKYSHHTPTPVPQREPGL